jgi:hypothetical protein
MSIKRTDLPLKPKALIGGVDLATAASGNLMLQIPDEIWDHIFSFLPKETCKAVSLVDKRFNHVMADHYTKRAISSLNYGFHVKIPLFYEQLATAGTSIPLGDNFSLNCKLIVMERKDHESLKAIHQFAIHQLRRFKEDPCLVKGLSRVDQAVWNQLSDLKLHPLSVTNRGEVISWEDWAVHLDFVSLPVLLKNLNTATFMY